MTCGLVIAICRCISVAAWPLCVTRLTDCLCLSPPVLLRIKVRFVDTVVRVEHLGQERGRGVGVELKIAW